MQAYDTNPTAQRSSHQGHHIHRAPSDLIVDPIYQRSSTKMGRGPFICNSSLHLHISERPGADILQDLYEDFLRVTQLPCSCRSFLTFSTNSWTGLDFVAAVYLLAHILFFKFDLTRSPSLIRHIRAGVCARSLATTQVSLAHLMDHGNSSLHVGWAGRVGRTANMGRALLRQPKVTHPR